MHHCHTRDQYGAIDTDKWFHSLNTDIQMPPTHLSVLQQTKSLVLASSYCSEFAPTSLEHYGQSWFKKTDDDDDYSVDCSFGCDVNCIDRLYWGWWEENYGINDG